MLGQYVPSLIRKYAADFGLRTLIQLLHGPARTGRASHSSVVCRLQTHFVISGAFSAGADGDWETRRGWLNGMGRTFR